MKTSLKENLKNYITSYKPREELRAYGEYLNFDAENTGRQLRHLTREGKIKRVWKGKYIIGYEPKANSIKFNEKQATTSFKGAIPNYLAKQHNEELKREESKQGVLI